MVYGGRPSRGCGTCKQRHTRCDETRPVCKRCMKAKRTCLGYKDEFDLNLRRHSNAVPQIRKVYGENSQQQSLQTAKEPLPIVINQSGTLNCQLKIPWIPQALEIFLTDFLLRSQDKSVSRGYFNNIVPLLNSYGPHSLLAHSTEAVALVSLANKRGAGSLALTAAEKYGSCLGMLRTAITDPAQQYSNEMLFSVLMMALYETIKEPEHGQHIWLSHLTAASEIMDARRRFQLSVDTGAHLYIELWKPSNLIINAVSTVRTDTEQSCEHLWPLGYDSLADDILAPEMLSRPQSEIRSLDRLLLRAHPVLETAANYFGNPMPVPKPKIQQLKKVARMMLADFELWPQCQPIEWQPRVIGHVKEPLGIPRALRDLDIYPGDIHVYHDLYVAGVWNTYRVARLRLLNVVLQCGQRLETNPDSFEQTREFKSLTKATELVASDICSCVPFHLYPDQIRQWDHQASQQGSAPKMLAGLFMLWPLYAGMILPLVPEQQRQWMRARLEWIGVHLGLGQALSLARVSVPFYHPRRGRYRA